MERTRKPWEYDPNFHSPGTSASTFSSFKLHAHAQASVPLTKPLKNRDSSPSNANNVRLREGLFVPIPVALPHKRNKQRDGLRPATSSHAASTSKSTSASDGSPIRTRRKEERRLGLVSLAEEQEAGHGRYATNPVPSTSIEGGITSRMKKSRPSTSAGSFQGVTDAIVPLGEPPPYEATELDVFMRRIEREEANYEDLLLLDELHAQPQATTKTYPFNISIGTVEVLHRRITKDGRTKLKHGVCGRRVETCGVCLVSFRGGERVGWGECWHCFHEQCLERWVARKAECPVCRINFRV